MKIILLWEDDNFIEITLLNNPAVNRWYHYFKDDSLKYKLSSIIELTVNSITEDLEIEVNQHYQRLKNVVNDAKLKFNHKSPLLNIPENFTRDQQLLNKLHRFFTYHSALLFYLIKEPNKYDPNFKIDFDKENEWFKIIEEINQLVHLLERYTLPQINLQDTFNNGWSLPELLVTIPKNLTKPWNEKTIHFSEEEILHNYNFNLNDSDEYSVVLAQNILGKCVLQSYAEMDDPTEFDCTGRLLSFGDFVVDLSNNRRKIYNSKFFKKWLKRYNKEPEQMPLEFQIGKVTKFSDSPESFINKSGFKEIIFT